MLITFERICRFKSRFLRLRFLHTDNAKPSTNLSEYQISDDVDQWDSNTIRHDDAKCLKIAILGLPNVGKSTLINRLVGRPVCAASSKVQTTRAKSDAVYVEGSTQLVVIDTPGLVTNRDLQKFHLEKSFRTDVQQSVDKADIIGVVQDAGHPFKSSIIDDRVMQILKQLQVGIPSILILNKVDKVKKKQRLLELVDVLTSDNSWPNFSDVFMVSALQDDGIDDLRNYLLQSAKYRDWSYDDKAISDDPQHILIERAVRARFMDHLPQELPYVIKVATEHMGTLADGSISAIVAVTCPTDRISKVIMGKGGGRVRAVALETEQELCQLFRTTVRLKIAVKFAHGRDTEPVTKPLFYKRKNKSF